MLPDAPHFTPAPERDPEGRTDPQSGPPPDPQSGPHADQHRNLTTAPPTATLRLDPLSHLSGFGPGTHVMTSEGELPVDWLATGDRLLTRDHGVQPILWIGRKRVTRSQLEHYPELAPVEIAAGALGDGFPSHPTRLSPRTRLLLSGWELELMTGTEEALAEVVDLTDDVTVGHPPCVEGTHYTYILMPHHALVQANGLWTETLLLDRMTTRILGPEMPERILTAPEVIAGHHNAARLCLAGWEVTAIRGTARNHALPALIRCVA